MKDDHQKLIDSIGFLVGKVLQELTGLRADVSGFREDLGRSWVVEEKYQELPNQEATLRSDFEAHATDASAHARTSGR